MNLVQKVRRTVGPTRLPSAMLTSYFLFSSLLTHAAFALDGWQTFTPEDAAFRLEMPAEPSTERKERWFPVSDFVSVVYTARIGDDAFGLNHTDLPRVALWFASKGKIFQEAREGFIEDSNATEVSFDETEFDGRPARELVYDIPANDEAPPLRGRARMFFEKNRLYIIWAEVTETVTPKDLDRYFASLRVGPPES